MDPPRLCNIHIVYRPIQSHASSQTIHFHKEYVIGNIDKNYDNMVHAHCLLDPRDYKNTLRTWNSYCFCTAKIIARSAWILRYTYITCVVIVLHIMTNFYKHVVWIRFIFPLLLHIHWPLKEQNWPELYLNFEFVPRSKRTPPQL
jgi:hypothetical protein